MIVVDGTHLRVLQSGSEEAANRLVQHLLKHLPAVTTVVNVQESLNGWSGACNQNFRTVAGQIQHYQRLEKLLAFFSEWEVLPFDELAAAEFQRIRRMEDLRQIGHQDLRIAAVALSREATVLSGNKHFTQIAAVTGLRVVNW